ncbi:hypothetical protein [Candidatus Nitrosocosmicus arcticus]|uniref:Uncharacterized protein n=1 Tax=Candidatus Nitrosocosmicus arcticus TaxID=2035267 RepID=A0A557SUC4_9ARCH|nr:hypothetical protein [Candidatus Nitrosocosmicus arcticus]TVP40206.1 hypothetical protein NARC_90112 [Candidatus Nitrosocosmicus arcticus]
MSFDYKIIYIIIIKHYNYDNYFTSGFNSNGHLSETTVTLIPSLETIFLILNQLLPLNSIMEVFYAEEHYFDSKINRSNFDGMYDNKSQIFGKSYEDWTAKWWKWAYSIPVNENPAYDDCGINCNKSQVGPVWFFSGTFKYSATRSCLVPDNVGILFPILNSECSYIEYPAIKSMDGLTTCAKSIQNHVSIGKHIITFEGGFSNGSQEYHSATNNSASFCFPIGWDYETIYDFLVLPSESYNPMKNVPYTSGE